VRRFAFYVSAHGFGHAVRIGALLAALRERAGGGIELLVRSEAPSALFARRDPAALHGAARVDVGVIQRSALELDLPASLAAHEAFLADWDAAVAREADWLREVRAELVVGDVPPLAFAAAERAGMASFAVANFSWDWILEAWAADEPRWRPVVARYADAYGGARRLFRLPLHGELRAFAEVVDVPFLVNRSRADPARTVEALGFAAADPRPLVLVSFGGFGSGPLAPARWDALDAYRFAGFGPAPPGFPAPWRSVPGSVAHEDVVAACDVAIGKPGYSTCAEVIAHRARFLHLPRTDFREVAPLEAGLASLACAQPMPRADFFAGRWRRHLDAILARPRPAAAPPAHGAEAIADALLELARDEGGDLRGAPSAPEDA
jgi:L-arabinokinase